MSLALTRTLLPAYCELQNSHCEVAEDHHKVFSVSYCYGYLVSKGLVAYMADLGVVSKSSANNTWLHILAALVLTGSGLRPNLEGGANAC